MNCCKSDQCRGIEEIFHEDVARDDLEEYRARGPSKQTFRLLQAIRKEGVEGASLLDVGGGVGAIQHELALSGVARIEAVDASPAYIRAAREEAERQGYASRATYRMGDFVDLAPQIEPVDIVTLDRVICCYHDMPAMIDAVIGRARRVIGLVYPVDHVLIRLGMGAINLVERIRRSPFRVFVHPPEEVDARIRAGGFEMKFHEKGFLWQVVVYARSA